MSYKCFLTGLSNLRQYLLQLYFSVHVCVHTQMRVCATREKHMTYEMRMTPVASELYHSYLKHVYIVLTLILNTFSSYV